MGLSEGFMASLRIWWILVVVGEGAVVVDESVSYVVVGLGVYKWGERDGDRALRK